MPERTSATSWCWAGLALAAVLGFLLADARDLFSATERLAGIDLGVWLPARDIGLADVAWSWRITPIAAWWGMACGLMAYLLGWQATASAGALPMGATGGLMWIAMLSLLFGGNLIVASVGWCGLSLCIGIWLVWQTRSPAAALGVRRFLSVSLLGDLIWLAGVLLTGLAWRTFDFASLESLEFVHEGWKRQPAVCGLAASCLLIGITARCGLFPLLAGWHTAGAFGGTVNAWAFGLYAGPMTAWMFLRVWPLLSCPPETVALGQGLCLIGAICNAFLATGQTDPRRTIVLLASSQYGILISASIVPDLLDPHSLAPAIWGASFVAIALLISANAREVEESSSLPKRWLMLLALCLLTGSFPSSVFWVSTNYLQAANQRISSLRELESTAETESDSLQAADRLEGTFRPEPMPSLTWCAAWSLWMFFSAFAGWRAWRLNTTADALTGNYRVAGLIIGALACSAMVVPKWLLAMDEFSITKNWQIGCGIGGALAGWALSAWICRNSHTADQRFQQLGSWPRLVSRELYWNELFTVAVEWPVQVLAWLAGAADRGLHDSLGKAVVEKVLGPVIGAVDELRSQSASFYAGALLLTIGSLLLTWLSLSG